jgi:hypothetical protein
MVIYLILLYIFQDISNYVNSSVDSSTIGKAP